MEVPLRSVFAVAMALLPLAAVFRFFPWTRRPWLATGLGFAALRGVEAACDKVWADSSYRLIGTAEFVAAFVAVLCFYEWRDKSGRAYGGYSALSDRGKRFARVALLLAPVAGLFVLSLISATRGSEHVGAWFRQALNPRQEVTPPGRYSMFWGPQGGGYSDTAWMLDTATGQMWHTCGRDEMVRPPGGLRWCNEGDAPSEQIRLEREYHLYREQRQRDEKARQQRPDAGTP
jgi:hypothetical protein